MIEGEGSGRRHIDNAICAAESYGWARCHNPVMLGSDLCDAHQTILDMEDEQRPERRDPPWRESTYNYHVVQHKGPGCCTAVCITIGVLIVIGVCAPAWL